MHKGTKYRHGYLSIKGAEWGNGPKKALKEGLVALGSVWARGYLPKDLWLHYLLTWFTFSRGRVLLQARKMGFHRNTLLLHFKRLGKFKRSMRLRVLWNEISDSKPRLDYFGRVVLFLKSVKAGVKLADSVSRRLARLWTMGFPVKVLSSHYVLWGFRNGWTREKIAENLGISMRTLHRLRVYSAKKGSPAEKWLQSEGAAKREWYPRWKRSGRRKKRTTTRRNALRKL